MNRELIHTLVDLKIVRPISDHPSKFSSTSENRMDLIVIGNNSERGYSINLRNILRLISEEELIFEPHKILDLMSKLSAAALIPPILIDQINSVVASDNTVAKVAASLLGLLSASSKYAIEDLNSIDIGVVEALAGQKRGQELTNDELGFSNLIASHPRYLALADHEDIIKSIDKLVRISAVEIIGGVITLKDRVIFR